MGWRSWLAGAWLALVIAPLPAAAKPIEVKVVVLTTFEAGADTGDAPGEFQAWAERWPLKTSLKVPGIERPVRVSDDGVLGVVTGMRGRARESVAALVLSPQFDLSHAYWLVAGIAGVDPSQGAIGSAAWARYVVDADPPFELDDRELPPGWDVGLYGPGADRPGVKGSAPGSSDMVWRLDPGLVTWAYGLTRDVTLPGEAAQAVRTRFASEAAAQAPPRVFLGDALGTVRFWHGVRRTQWARTWMKTWTDGAGVFAMSDCEDQGILDVLSLHGREGRIDPSRILVLRTASNYTREGDGEVQAVEFTEGGARAGFEAAWRAGSPVVRALVAGWARYRDLKPGARP